MVWGRGVRQRGTGRGHERLGQKMGWREGRYDEGS